MAVSVAWRRALLLGALLATGSVFVPSGHLRDVAYLLVGGLGIAAILVGIRVNRPPSARAWYAIAAGNGAWLLGDAMYRAYPSGAWVTAVWGVLPFALGYVVLAVGLLMLGRGRDRWQWTAILDTAILTTGIGLVSWVVLVIPGWAAAGVAGVDGTIAVAYPMADVALVALCVRLMTGQGFWVATSRLLTASMCVLLTSNALTQIVHLHPELGIHEPLLKLGWLLAYLLWGAAALHPSMRTLGALDASAEREGTMRTSRLLGLTGAVMTGPAIVALEVALGLPLHPWPIVIGSAVLVILVLLRMVRMVQELRGQASRLNALTETDHLTGLLNRRGLVGRLGVRMDDPGQSEARVGLLRIDKFSDLNATLGYATGDALLIAFSERLVELRGMGGLVARIGGNTFAIVNFHHSLDYAARALALREAMELPYELADLRVSVDVCLGVAAVPDDATSPDRALHCASVALAQSVTRPGRIARYAPEMESGGTFTTELIGQLPEALLRDELVLHYQPQVEVATGRVFGVEALVRWQHPVHGLLAADVFIPGAERSGLIGPLTYYVLDHAIAQCARWRREGLELTVAVNLSVRNLLDPGLIPDVRSLLTRHALPADALELEITEGTVMVDAERSLDVLGRLAALGITLSIDDFGTGHSSLAYLHRLPVQRLKIDRSFVTDLLVDTSRATIVRSTIDLARSLNLHVLAEGVEDDRTLLALQEMRCDAAQGFGLGRPVPADQLPALVLAIEARIPALVDVPAAGVRPGAPAAA